MKDRRGNFAVMFALTAPILILLIGMGLDFLVGLSFKSRWDAAADAAALAGNNAAIAYANANAATETTTQLVANAILAGEAAGLKAFNANAGISESTGKVTPNVVTTNSGTKFTTTASYTGSTTSFFGGLVSITSLSLAGSATATQSATTYINYYILIDISQSMGIGTTQADMSNLYNITKGMGYAQDSEPGCVFGCHVTSLYSQTNEAIAHANGITLRIDSARTAVQGIIAQAQAQATNGNIQFALYTMQDDPITNSSTAVQIAAMSSNYANLTTAANTIDLGENTSGGIGDTDLKTTLSNFATNTLPSQGSGFSAQSPLNYVMIVTDGMLDTPGACQSGHCTGVISSTTCQSLQQNATVGVIYTTYLPIYHLNDPNSSQPVPGSSPTVYTNLQINYYQLVLPYQASIAPSLQSCATDLTNYFEASDGPSLISAMSNLFQSSLNSLRLTQ
jgi:Flp pilus assembly protein TadG